MNKDLRKRLQALQERATSARTGIVPIEFETDEHGDIAVVVIPSMRQKLSLDEFWALFERNVDVAYVPFRGVPDRRQEALHALEDEAALYVRPEDLYAENEAVARAVAEGRPVEGPGVLERAWERAAAADPERAALAQEYMDAWEWAVEYYYDPMRERVDRLSKQGR